MRKRFQSLLHRLSGWLDKITWPQLALGFAVAIILAVAGQVVLTNGSGLTGVILYALAGILFVTVAGVSRKRPEPSEEEGVQIRRHVPAFLFGLAGLGLMAFVLIRLESYPDRSPQNYLTLAGWLLSLACFSIAVLMVSHWRPPGIRSLFQSLRSHKWETVFVVCLLLAALVLRIFNLGHAPYPMIKDEAELGSETLKILHGEYANLIMPGWAQDPLLSSAPEIITIGLLGSTVFAIRLASAIIGALSIVFLYFLARAMFDRTIAMLAALCLLALPPHLHFSRLGVNNVIVCLWAAIILWLTWRAIQKGRPADYLWAGLATGVPLYSYLGSRLISVLAVGMLFYTILTRRGYLKSQWRNLLVFVLALAFVAAPTLSFTFHHPADFLTRLRSDNIFSSRWLVSEPVNSGRSIPVALLDQFRKSTLVFISDPAWRGFYDSPYPYLPAIGAVFLVLGFVYSLFHLRDLRYLLLQVWFWAVVILGSVIFPLAPSTEKLVGSLPAVAIFAGIGLAQVAGMLKQMKLFPARLIDGVAIGLMVLTAVQGAWFYLGEYQQQRYFAHPYEEFEMEVSQYVQTLGPDNRLYLLAAMPLEAGYFPAHDYLIPEIPVQDLPSVTAETVGALPRDKGLIFVSIPERKADLDTVAQLLPGGQWREMKMRPIPGQPDVMLYYLYQLPPAPATGP